MEDNNETPELNLDAMFQQAVDEDAAKQILSDMLVTAGWYRTLPPVKMTPRTFEGRFQMNYYAAVAKAPKKGEPFEPTQDANGNVRADARFGFTVSHVRKNKHARDESGQYTLDTGEPDQASINWSQALKAFNVAAGRKAENNGEVYQYLETQPILIRITEFHPTDGDPKNYIGGLSPVRE